MAKRMLSLLLAAVMVLGMLPVISLAAVAEEAAAPAPLWSADFDAAGTVYTGSEEASVWSVFYQNAYLLTVKEEDDGNGYMSVVPNGETDSTTAFNLTSDGFTPTDAVWVTFDMSRAAADSDCLYFSVLDADGKGLAQLFIRPSDGKIAYNRDYFVDAGSSWGYTNYNTAAGWQTLRVLVSQSAAEGGDVLKVYLGDTLVVDKTGTFAKGTAAPAKISFGCPGGYKSKFTELGLDNIAVYAYAPATAAAFAAVSYAVEAGKTVQTALVLTPVVPVPDATVSYSSDQEAVATVDAKGLVTGVAEGTAKITATVTNQDGSTVTAEAAVTVTAPEKQVPAAVSAPAWSADFDDPSKVYDQKNTGSVTNSVWKEYSPNSYTLSIAQEESGNKYLRIQGGTDGTAFVLRSTNMTAMNKAVVSLDLLRQAANNDGFHLAFEDEDRAALALLFVWPQSGKIAYNITNFGETGGPWKDTGLVVSHGDWENIKVAVVQSDVEGEDQIIVTYGGQTKTITGTFSKSGKGVNNILLYCPGGYQTVIKDLGLDNIEVYPYAPAEEVTLSQDSYTLEAGQTARLAATVSSKAACITGIAYSSDDEAVATVDANGLVTAVGSGSANITVTVTNADGSAVTAAAAVTVTAPQQQGATPVWSADFDDPSKVYDRANGGAVTNSVWKGYSPNSYTLSIAQEESGNKYLRIQGGTEGTAFVLRSTNMAPMNKVAMSLDILRQAANKDGFHLAFEDEDGKALALLFVWPQSGKIAYNTANMGVEGGSWKDTGLVVSYGDWENIKVAVVQSDAEGEDQIIVTYGGQTKTITGTFSKSAKSVNNILLYCPGGYQNAITDLGLDNLAVYEMIDVTAVAFEKDAYEVEGGETVQLTASVTPANAYPDELTYTSSNPAVATVDANGVVTGVSPGTVTITATAASGVSATATVTVKGVGNVVVWEEDFEAWDLGSDGGFDIRNNQPTLGSIKVEDATAVGGTGNAIVLRRIPDVTKITLIATKELPAAVEQVVFEYDVRDVQGGHGNMRLPMPTSDGTEAGRHIAIFLASGSVYYNVDVNTPTAQLGTDAWRHVKLIMNTATGAWSLWLDGEQLGSGTSLRNNEPMKYFYFQAAYESQNVTNGIWYDNFKVSVHIPAEAVEIDGESITLQGTQTYQLTTNLTPAKANDQLMYISSDPSVVTVDCNGVLTGVKPGTATITVKASEGIEDTVAVTVEPVAVQSITLSAEALTLPVGAHTFLQATVTPENAIPNTVTFASSDESIVTVDAWGEIVCLKAGTATITASCGDVSKSILVTVGDPTVMKTIQVSPNGTSLADALAQIAAINATEEKMTGNIEVVLADGYYYIDETVKMNETHGGTNGYSVVWKAAAGATPIIGGGKYFSGSQFADADGDGIYTMDLSKLGIPKVADPDTMATTRQLFVNDVRATRARSEGGLTNAYYYMDGTLNRGHVSEDEYLADFARIQDLEFVYQELWTHPRAGVSAITKNGDGTVNITMDQPGWSFASNKSASSCGSDGPAWIENALELLDQPGEWYLNEETQILYYIPRSWENMADATFMLPLMDDYDPDGGISGLMHIEGTDYDNMVHNIRFEGITFADTTWTRPSTENCHSDAQNNHIRESGDRLPDAAITVAKANGVSFTGCTFTRLGITAVKMVRGVQNSHFVGNHFYDISGSAINIGDPYYSPNYANPSDLRMMMKNDDVLNNYIHNIGVDFNSSAAVSLGFGADMNFSYNEIFNMPYSGFHIGYGWQVRFDNCLKNLVISNNFIHDFMGDGVADGGGIYTLGNSGGDDDNYNKIHSNYIKTVLDNAGPLYCDEGSTYYELYNNLVDLSKVVNGWSNGTVKLSWLQMNAASHHLKVHDNFATVSRFNWNSTGSEVENAQLEDPNNWSAGAQAVIDGAGLQSEYDHLRKGHAELILVNLEDGADMQIGDSMQLSVSYTDGKDKPVSGGSYIKAFDTTTPDIIEVTADGKVTALKQGTAIVRIWVVSNDILDVVEKTIYVEDEIESVILENFEGKDTLSMSDEADGIALKPYAVTKMGRVKTPTAEQYTITVADESVAKIVDGVLVPVSVGSTTLTVKMEIDGMVGEVTYKVEITLAKTFTVDYLEDLFNSDKKDWTNANNATTWEQVEDTSLTTKLYGWTTYSGRTFENELLTFKLKLDITQTGGWPCFVIRADSATASTAGGGASGYVLCFGGKNKAGTIELQRWNAKSRTMIIGDLEGFEPVTGIYNMPHGVDDGEEHLIQFGALTDGGKTRLVLYIDGVKKFDFLDESADAITAPGYFGIIGRNEVYYLSHATAEDSYLMAAIGGEMYNDLQDALDAAKEGETVKLLAGVEAEGVMVKEGIGLDLNGHVLTTDYLVAFSGGQVSDSIGGGTLKCTKVRLGKDNAYMPVWVEAEGGYRFFTMLSQQKYRSQSENGFVFIAKPALGSEANDALMAQSETSGLTIKMRLNWTSNSGKAVEQFFLLSKEDTAEIYSNSNKIILLSVTGAGAYAGKLYTTTYIESETGVVWAAPGRLYNGE